jgi:iron complex outermembrane receptor protein
LTGGLRWSEEEKDASLDSYTTEFGSNKPAPELEWATNLINGRQTFLLEDNRKTDNWSPTVNLQWDYSDSGMAYARFSRGYKSGGFNAALVDGNADIFEFDDEEADTYELGIKMELADGAATLNAAVFYTEFGDRQVSSFTETGFVVGNAAESTSQGFELEGRWRIHQYLGLSMSVAYLESEYDDFSNANCSGEQVRAEDPVAGCDPVSNTQDLTDETTSHAPDWAGTMTANFNYPVTENLELLANIDVIYTDEVYLTQSLDSNLIQDSYTKVNARVAVGPTSGDWELAVVGKNLTDESTSHYGAGIPLFPGGYFNAVNPPRTVAVEGVYRF